MSDDLTGKVVVITGASGGIGEGTAYAMAAEGANVALLARRPEPLERVAAKARKLGVEVLAQAGDVSDRASVAEFVDQIEHELGVPDVLVNNAGINTVLRGVSDITMEDWDQVVDVNLTGPFNLVRAVLPAMKRNGGGLIINIVSLAGKTASTLAGAAYSASKFGLAGLTESINDEERKHGIRATAIFPRRGRHAHSRGPSRSTVAGPGRPRPTGGGCCRGGGFRLQASAKGLRAGNVDPAEPDTRRSGEKLNAELAEFDLLFQNATIYDGAGNPARRGSVAVKGSSIAAVGDIAHSRAKEVLDLDGLAISPGFIDTHGHSDFPLLVDPSAQSKVRQGVTTEIIGNCGFSPAPVTDINREAMVESNRFLAAGAEFDWVMGLHGGIP